MRLPALMFVLMFVLMTTGASADTLELISGERLEGRVKDMTTTSVGIEVGGQQIRVERAKVRAMYFGAPVRQAPPTPPVVADALSALKALGSAVSAGLTYRDYVPRVADTKIHVDRAVVDGNTPPAITASLSDAMSYYILAARLWQWEIGHPQRVNNDLGVSVPSCVDSGSLFTITQMEALWKCASAKIAEAEKQSLGK